MKKFLFVTFFILGTIIGSVAQTYKYYTTELAYKAKNDYGYWTEWSDWESCRCLITISFDRDVINIYSSEPQEFDVYDYYEGISEDGDDGRSLTLKCVDREGLRCEIRLRMQANKQMQLYVDYSDFMYVYNIVPKD